MSVGLIALFDDIAALTKVAAASLDDIAGQAAKAGTKAAGVVIDDAAVTPRYLVGFSASRELPIVRKIALASLRNKLLILLPAALALDRFVPWVMTPLLMLGGIYLCYEGAEKLLEVIVPHRAQEHEAGLASPSPNPQAMENARVASAVKTDFILSAEIMAIALASLTDGSVVSKGVALAIVAVGITVAVYGAVALIVKADDAGLALAANTSPSLFGAAGRALGRGLVKGVPVLLKCLSIVGTGAMLWVGGGIIVHGLAEYKFTAPEAAIHHLATLAAAALPAVGSAVGWIATATGSGIVGLAVGALAIPIAHFVLAPVWKGAFARS